ncbi:hypothetical protein KC19_3G115700 [Ceratodon purpureus]|uniref:Secreted protein n=1 Tax=Ceratodon purpureus TaxID=3225 RepID=A0A8T0IIP4_CERPU|nr:hypothetical protein KC19_3G115700 [Ceratodon purpureus]
MCCTLHSHILKGLSYSTWWLWLWLWRPWALGSGPPFVSAHVPCGHCAPAILSFCYSAILHNSVQPRVLVPYITQP